MMTDIQKFCRHGYPAREALRNSVKIFKRPFALVFIAAALAANAPALAQDAPAGMSQQVFQQIQAISSDKAQWNAAQKKLEPALIYAARVANGLAAVPGADPSILPQMVPNNLINPAGQVLVDINSTDVVALGGQIVLLGGSVISSFPQYNAIRASLPLSFVEALASDLSVKSIKAAEVPVNNRIVGPIRPPFEVRSQIVRAQLKKALGGGSDPGVQTNAGFGTTVSEAVLAHGADIAQNAGYTGAGVKVCVMSDGVNTLAARQASGNLPATVQILSGQAGSGDEGTAMLELVADMAPGATLAFSTGNGGQAQFATNIIGLRNTLNCNIIVDDISYTAEAAFQEGIVANGVTTAVNAGAMYFSSSANSGHLSGGQSGTWEGDFVDGGVAIGILAGAGSLHNFGAALFNTLTVGSSTVSLHWSDPLGASGNDYDLFVVNSAGTTIIGFGSNTQSGTQDPFESTNCGGTCPAGAKIYVARFSGSQRALRVDTHRGRLTIGTNGSTYGHNGGVNTISVGAVSNSNGTPISGRKFNAGDTTTPYSSDGPRRLFLNPTPLTTPITAGCYLYSCGGGTILPKVDIAAADCNTTTTPGFTAFFCGTSAAAPQAAAIAALVKSSSPGLSNAQILARLKGTALDIMVGGPDVDSGAGIIRADVAIAGGKLARDFSGDGSSDILWRDTAGNTVASLVSGGAINSSTFLVNLPAPWSVAATGDFNGDGKADILWRNTTTGDTVVSTMNGASIVASNFIVNLPAPWIVAGVGDFNGDGRTDILWRNTTTGDMVVSFMSGGAIALSSYLLTLPAPWAVAGVGDFNGDGRADILWRNTSTGDYVVSLVGPGGQSVTSSTFIVNLPAPWSVAGIGDFNGDNMSDILWRNTTTGDTVVSFLYGGAIVASTFVVNLPAPWTVAAIGDVNGDRNSDIIWRDLSNGNTVFTLMNGAAITSSTFVVNLATNWTLQPGNAN